MIKDVESVARKTYQRGIGVGFVDTEEMRACLGLLARGGRLRAHLLYAAGEPRAFWVGTVHGHTFHSNFMGYDPGLSQYSPGMFLVMRVIEDLCSQEGQGRIREIDFGLGDAQYKRVLGDTQWGEASVYIYAPTLKGISLNALRTSGVLIDTILRAALERARLFLTIKRLWRDHAVPRGCDVKSTPLAS